MKWEESSITGRSKGSMKELESLYEETRNGSRRKRGETD